MVVDLLACAGGPHGEPPFCTGAAVATVGCGAAVKSSVGACINQAVMSTQPGISCVICKMCATPVAQTAKMTQEIHGLASIHI